MSSWDDYVGQDANVVQVAIESVHPLLNVRPIPVGTQVDNTFVDTRVWLYFDPQTNLVTQTPKVG